MFKNPFSFDGRIRRTEYGLTIIIFLVVWYFCVAMVESDGSPAICIVLLPMLYIRIAQASKRCHDLGSSGWWQIVPFYGFMLLFSSSNYGPNEYGDNPKGEGNDAEDVVNFGPIAE